jgi:arylsulfatase A-like enzyme
MESETPTGHATIVTGVYPRKHGVIGFGWRIPATGAFSFMPTDLRQIDAGALTNTMELSGVPTLSDLIHARDPHDLTVSLSGEKYYAAAAMGAGADYVFYGKDMKTGFRPQVIGHNVPPAVTQYTSISEPDSTPDLQDQFSASLAIQLARTLRPRALLVNLPGSDIAGHYYGGMRDTKDMTPIVRGDDWAIGRIVNAYRQLGLLNNTIFVVTADHGMASNRHIVPIHSMYKAEAAVAPALDEEYRITVGSIWLRDPRMAAAVATTMAARSSGASAPRFPGVEGAFYKTTNPTGASFVPDAWTAAHMPRSLLRAYLDLADTEASAAGPDVLLPYVEDATGLFLPKRALWGNHGGFSWGVQHIPLIIAGPGVRPGVSQYPAKLVDIAPTIERLLGLSVPAKVDGVVLADALARSTVVEQNAQQSLQAGRMRDVRVLRDHSLAQSR